MIRKAIFLIILTLTTVACNKVSGPGISAIENPKADKQISVYGETVTITFAANAAWTAELVLNGEGEWATISQTTGTESAGQGIIRIRFTKNENEEERTAELYVTVDGYEKELIATLTQAAGENKSSMSEYLNKYMHERLLKEYLWADEYSKLNVGLGIPYDKFLYTHLTQLGDINIEDGGYYRDYSSAAGQRYIYSYISEVTSTKSTIATKAGELSSTFGLGIGPLFASIFESGTDYIGLTVGYVYPGSPAETAGLKRGDTIYQVGNNRITRSNYQNYMQELFYNPSGKYKISFARYVVNEAAQRYDLTMDNVVEFTAESYGYNPIIFAAIMTNSNIENNEESNTPEFNIGYMASESFDSSAQEVLEYQIQQFIDAGITELILDLRFNVGGEVQQSRYLASSIVGRDYDDKHFFKAEFNDGRVEPWRFQSGPAESDKLGEAPSMGLKRLWVIMSENTASASELIIHGLKGVDFPVTLIGSRSEGKNVGMVVTQEVYNGRRFEFAPITYRGMNHKNEYAPADGFEPDFGNLLNNQDSSYQNDADNMFPYSFGDWGNFDFNPALYCCFCDIIGEERPDYGVTSATVKSSDLNMRMQANQIQNSVRPIEITVMKPEIGRFGTVIRK